MHETKSEHVHVFFDDYDQDKACILFQRGTEWQLLFWELETNTITAGQWLTKSKLSLKHCYLYKGFFCYDFLQFKPEYQEYQVISRMPYFTALLLFRASCTSGIRIVKSGDDYSSKIRCVHRGDDHLLDLRTRPPVISVEDWIVWGPEWGGWDNLATTRGEQMVAMKGPALSSKPVAPNELCREDKMISIDGPRVVVDGEVVIDLSENKFCHVSPPANYHE